MHKGPVLGSPALVSQATLRWAFSRCMELLGRCSGWSRRLLYTRMLMSPNEAVTREWSLASEMEAWVSNT